MSYEPFCLPVVCHRARSGSVALRKGPWRFCPHRSGRCRELMLTCPNSPLWQRCEHCNNVFVFVLAAMAQSIEQRVHHVTWALIGTSRKLATYNYTSKPSALNNAEVRAGGCKWRYQNSQSRTCYQECGCHLIYLGYFTLILIQVKITIYMVASVSIDFT